MLQETLESSVATDEFRREIFAMGKSYAQVLIERGREAGLEEGRDEAALAIRKQTLIRLLSKKFGSLPTPVSETVTSTDDTTRLDGWLENFATAETLEDVGIN